MPDSTVAFVVDRPERPALEICVNFGIHAGRAATPAEIDRLAAWLLDEVDEVSIVAEERHEIDAHAEAVVHQVRIEIGSADPDVERRILERAQHWAQVCAAERRADVTGAA